MITASCHCGAVHIELDRAPTTVTQCTCSICRRYGALWVYRTRQTARVLCKPDAVKAYLWDDRVIEFYHCTTCGCLTHYESTEKAPESRIAVNGRMLAPEMLAAARLRTFDGADTWAYVD